MGTSYFRCGRRRKVRPETSAKHRRAGHSAKIAIRVSVRASGPSFRQQCAKFFGQVHSMEPTSNSRCGVAAEWSSSAANFGVGFISNKNHCQTDRPRQWLIKPGRRIPASTKTPVPAVLQHPRLLLRRWASPGNTAETDACLSAGVYRG